MIYADDLEENHIQDNTGEWHIAKPIEDSSFFRRLIDAWRVLKGECLAVKFWSWEMNRAFNKDWLRLRLETNE